jgi:hypothetical protein
MIPPEAMQGVYAWCAIVGCMCVLAIWLMRR